MTRRILHLDMDAFYASVAQRDDPSLRGKPVVVGGDPQGRGVVMAASYEARQFGVRSAMSMAKALRLCPPLVIARPNFSVYKAVSQQVFEIYRSVTPLVEPLSLDEAYLDVTENAWQEPLGTTVAKRLKAEVRAATNLTVSAGVAPNKFLAKIASGWQKPDGLTVIAPERVEPFLRQLPVDALWGVGPVTAGKLRAAGLSKLVDVRAVDRESLSRIVGSLAGWLHQLARGIDDRAVSPHHEPKSSGQEHTYAQDLVDLDTIRTEVARMAERAAQWLVKKELYAKTVTLKVRYDDFSTITRNLSGPIGSPPTREEREIVGRALTLLDRTEAGTRPIRLLGVSVHGFSTDPAISARPASARTASPRGSRANAASGVDDPHARLPFDAEDAGRDGSGDS
jgi:DNA polymerase-4